MCLNMRHGMKQQILVLVLGGAAIALTSCQTFQNLFDRSRGSVIPEAIVEEVTVTPAAVMEVRASEVDEPRDNALKADNARLQRQLAGALKENAKLKKDLADLRDDNSLLKDLAAKKTR
jgi:hypothetical protein